MNIIWFREDLRINDNTALHYAASEKQGVIAVYFMTPKTWQAHDMAPCRIDFLLNGVLDLQKTLLTYHIPLYIFSCPSFQDIPGIFEQLVTQYNIKKVFCNKQYEINEKERDSLVEKKLAALNVNFHAFDDKLIFAPNVIKTQENKPFTVFTPFKKKWLAHLNMHPTTLLNQVAKQPQILYAPPTSKNYIAEPTFNPALISAGEQAAEKTLHHFLNNHILSYEKERDFPALNSTSHLSPYLSAGMISARTCLQAALQLKSAVRSGIDCWINELIWREFYVNILYAFPRVCQHKPFKLPTDKLNWSQDPTLLAAWQQGKTGFPIIDAAMRQLNQTGWMHNRLRMLTAVFFTKLLWLDWRLGEKYFMQHLIDGDLAANNGGWQWCASTGTDAVPYFRIFNPTTQSERFDPEGKFIRTYCPELGSLDNKAIHAPYAVAPLESAQLDYPEPIIDYKKGREHALNSFVNL